MLSLYRHGFVTPTFKVKRNRIEDAYGEKYEGWLKRSRWCGWRIDFALPDG
jgi:long-chain acyl-CoA synthetase